MFKPVGFGVLIAPEDIDAGLKQDPDSEIIIPQEVKDKQRVETVIGTVLDFGNQAWKDLVDGDAWCAKGDRVLYAKHGGKIFQDPETDEDIVLVQDRDILGIMKGGKYVRV